MTAILRSTPAEGVLLLTLDRADRHNAITLDMQRAIDREVVAAAEGTDVRAIVLAGAGEKAFSAGNDIDELTSWTPDEVTLSQLERGEMLWRWFSSPVPTVTALRGLTYGAGTLYAVCSDLRIGCADTRIKVSATSYGGANLTWVLDTLVGSAVARDLVLTSRVVDGAEAQGLGLLSRSAEPGDVLDAAVAAAEQLAANPPDAVREAKRLMLEGHGFRARYDAENTAMFTTLNTTSTKDAFAGFLDRRASERSR